MNCNITPGELSDIKTDLKELFERLDNLEVRLEVLE